MASPNEYKRKICSFVNLQFSVQFFILLEKGGKFFFMVIKEDHELLLIEKYGWLYKEPFC